MKSWHTQLLALAMSVVTASSSGAAEPVGGAAAGDGLTLRGFGTIGIARSDNDQAQFVRDLSQPEGLTTDWSGKIDSMIGLQAGYRFDGELEGVVQAISRYRYDGSYRPEISWAFLRYDPDPALNLRVGRLGTEFYMQADSRLVGYSNLTVRPPPDYFGPLVFSYFDGLDIDATAPVGNGLLRGKLFAGISPETTPFVADITWDLSGSWLVGGYLDYLAGPWQVRIGHAQVRFDNELPLDRLPGFGGITSRVPDLSVAGKWTRFDSLGVVYDRGPLQLQLMLGWTEHDSKSFEDTRAGYAIAAYRIRNVTPYIGYSRTRSTPVELPASLPPLDAAQAQALAAGTHSDQHTWFLGGRWDIRQDLALKAQVDWIEGSPKSVFPFRDSVPFGADAPVWSGRMTVFSLVLDFVF